ncbi:MAG: glycoside hydrolase family 88 protein [Bacteroidales bacterium]|nr:glycoside hydrolase family 88 protein [Bacteroidales bacterium]
MKRIFLLLTAVCLLAACSRPAAPTLLDEINASLDLAVKQSLRMAASLEGRKVLPQTIDRGRLKTSNSSWWTSGFFGGQLWNLYDYSHNDSLRMWAEDYTMRVADQRFTTDNHDVGFMIFCSFGNGYRITGNPRYREIIDTASQSLITRFKPSTGCIRSWDDRRWQYAVIIDNMMNLEMLMWAGKTFHNPVYTDIAVTHANTTMKNHFRPDYSTWHVVSYDTITGIPDRKQTAQGYNDDSAWARGQSWGLYGYTMMFREARDSAYLRQAEHIADFLIGHPNMPEDKIPYWDYNAPDIPDALRDVSSGAIMCSALIELADYTDAERSATYMAVAEQQLKSMCSPAYRAPLGENCNFLLMHGVGNMPGRSEIDVPLTYADYYYVEAMLRYRSRMMRSATASADR